MTETKPKVETRTLLSTLWLFFLLNIIFRDIHQFLSPGYMDWVIAGEMFGQKITDELLLFGGIAVEVMILMVLLPHVLSRRVLRVVNTIAAIFTCCLILYTPPIDPDDWFFLVICLVTLAAITCIGWRRLAPETGRQDSIERALS